VVIAIIGTLVGLLLPAVQSAREAARRSGCSFNIRGLAQALMVYETTKRRLPAATDRSENTSIAGNTTNSDQGAGYSWIFHILPYMEEGAMYNNVSSNTSKFQAGPFSSSRTTGPNGVGGAFVGQNGQGQHAATVIISQLICPSYGGGSTVLTDATNAPDGSYAAPYQATTTTVGGDIAVTNYKAIAGTHMNPQQSGTRVPNMPSDNGAIVFAPDQALPSSYTDSNGHLASRAGVKQSAVSDGMSKTALIAESKERGFSAWIDGTVCWVVAYDPNQAQPGFNNGVWVTAVGGNTPVSETSLNFEATATPNAKYLLTAKFRASGIAGASGGMAYGPSSDHQGGITMHAFGDTHVQQVTGDIDPAVYMAICSRNGTESTASTD
jgi:type II secretory pathway pseudopilin PulG